MQSKEKTRYSDGELKEFKDLILVKKGSAREELSEIMSQLNDTDNEKVSRTDGASTTTERESLSQLASRLQSYIQNLDNALVRIGNKTYGICRETGKLIAKERLLAVPHTTLSMEAKLKQSA